MPRAAEERVVPIDDTVRLRELEAENAALREKLAERGRHEVELRHAQKLEAIGRLAAGIAHEINTPVQYVGDSLHYLRDACAALDALIAACRPLVDAARAAGFAPQLIQAIDDALAHPDLELIDSEKRAAFERAFEGLARVATTVRAMKEFASPDRRDKAPADVNQAILNTLVVARNEYKYVAEVETDLGALPLVPCHVGDLSQVFLQLIINAALAIADARRGTLGRIRIKSWREEHAVRVSVSDTGCGIPDELQSKIFEPYFTTREVGRGAGQGLAIARSIVVDKHGGTIAFESTPGRGSTFVLSLPTGPEDAFC